MLLQTCPFSLKTSGNPMQTQLGRSNIVAVHTTHRDKIENHTAPLSVKFVLQGSESYTFENQRLSVSPDKYIIVNKGQSYASEIHSTVKTVSFCVFFSDHFVSDACRLVGQSHEYLLDNFADHDFKELNFHQRLYWKEDRMSIFLDSFVHGIRASHHQGLRLDERCAELLNLLLKLFFDEGTRQSALSGLKPSTRQEVYKRLSASIDFIHENYQSDISLAALSAVSSMSSFHFLRSFKSAFKITPYQYLTKVRLQQACRLLIENDAPVSDIVISCGFQDESSFSRLFKARVGVSPSIFRKAS
jgi:AraC family transcriptional regulator